MSERDAAQRVHAWVAGRPIPRYSTLHFPICPDRDCLILAFVRMGGESAPWGIAIGRPGSEPTVYGIPEPRNRDALAEMVATAAPSLLRHFGHPAYGRPATAVRHRQIWVPNATHLAMLHSLAYAYVRARRGDEKRLKTLHDFGRLAEWLFRESQRPGQVTVMVSSDLLRSSYVFPTDPVREAHLGFLLAWLTTRGNRDRRDRAAREAERRSIATTLDPALERDKLEPLVSEWRDATKAEDVRKANALSRQIGAHLEKELTGRFRLVQSALEYLRADPRRVNAGTAVLVAASIHAWDEYLLNESRETPWIPSPETDYAPAAAAAAYLKHEAAETQQLCSLIHDDESLQQEAVAAGSAIRGVIRRIREVGPGRATIAVWTIDVPEGPSLRVREGSRLVVAGCPKRELFVQSVTRARQGLLAVEARVSSGIRAIREDGRLVAPKCDDPSLIGNTVTLVPGADGGFVFLKLKRVWDKDAPGAWLTHARDRKRTAAVTNE